MTDFEQELIRLVTEIHAWVKPKEKRQGKVQAQITGFDLFWKVYPKKVAVAEAEKAWNKIMPDLALRGKIIDAVVRQAKSEKWREDGGKFIPHPATWLNARRWEDQITVTKPDLPPVMTRITPTLPAGEAPPAEVKNILSKLLGKDMSF